MGWLKDFTSLTIVISAAQIKKPFCNGEYILAKSYN